MRLLEWNIHKMTTNILVKPFVYKRILSYQADVICLVEYVDDINIKNSLKNEYWLEESISNSGNQIFIAISKRISPQKPQVIKKTEEPLCYNFLHIRFADTSNKYLSVIGVRMLSPIDAKVQTPPLNKYLKTIRESFVCMGDFNIKGNRMKQWFPNSNYKLETLKQNDKTINNYSIIYTDRQRKIINGFGDVDHVLGSSNLKIHSMYTWDFLTDDDIYPQNDKIQINSTSWNIKPAYPDHAIMITDVDFT